MDEDYTFDPEAYGSGSVSVAPPPVFDPSKYGDSLPTVTPKRQTFYYPATPEDTRAAGLSYSMEGGIHGAGRFSDLDLRNHTLEKYRAGESPFVAVAMKGIPTGAEFMTPVEGDLVRAKNVDTGGGLRDGQQDIATSTPGLAKGGGYGFDPEAYGKGVPDIHAFMEPAPAEAETSPEPEAKENVGSLIGKGISKFGKALADRKTPKLDFTTPQIRQAFNQPQEAAQVSFNMIPSAQPTPAAQPTPFQPQQFQPNPMPFPTPSVMPTPQGQPFQAAPVMQGTMEGLQQTAAGLVPHTMEQFHGLAQILGAPTDPQAFFTSALQQGLVTSRIAQDAIKAGPLSKEAGKAYGTIIPQALMLAGGLSAAGAIPSAGAVTRSLTGANILPRAQESGAIGATGAPQGINSLLSTTGKISEEQLPNTREVPVPESFQPQDLSQIGQLGKGAVMSMYDMMFKKLQAGDLTEGGGPSSALRKAYPEFQSGNIKSPEDLQKFFNQPKGLPFKAASVQGLKNPPRQATTTYKTPSGNVTIKGGGNVPVPQSWKPVASGAPPVQPPTGGGGIPPSGGGIPPQPPASVPIMMKFRQIVDRITSRHDSVFTRADYGARQKVNELRQEFGQHVTKGPKAKENIQAAKDLEAATFIAEAQGNKIALKQDLELVKNSNNKNLAKKYTPVLQYAVDNFDRISNIKNRYAKLMQDQLAEDAAAGITYGEREGYVTHVLKNEPDKTLLSFFTDKMGSGGLSRYFTKNRQFDTLAEAINAGIDPASVNLADLAQHRIATSRRLILNKAMLNELKSVKAPDGNSVVRGVYRMPDPPHAPVVPQGYELLNANGTEVLAHRDYAGIFKALYGDSAMRRGPVGRTVMRAAGISKAYTLGADTYHGFRGIQKGLFYGRGQGRIGYQKGTSVYELSDSALDTAVKNKEISQSQADWAKSARPAVEEMMKNGLNVSRFADNLVQQLHVNFPGTRGLNDWIFNRVFRGSMIQAAHGNYIRNLKRWPELTKDQVARRTAKEMNEVYGNLMNQGLFRDKTVRDALNVTFLAPQWIESQVRAELRGYGQWGEMAKDFVTKGKFRLGTVAQGQATAVAAYLIGNQIINYATTGHSTFENDEHKLSAFLPIGERGVYLDPLALSAEYVGRFMDVMERQGEHASVPGVVAEIAASKLSRAGRAVMTLATQRDWRGKHLEGSDLYTQAGSDILPTPIMVNQLSKTVELDPNSQTGFNVQTDRVLQAILQSMGQRGVLGHPTSQYQGAPVRAPRRGRRADQGFY